MNDRFRPIIIAVLIAVGLIATQAGAASAKNQAASPIVAKCKADLAARFKLQAQNITVVEAKATTWPDAALGMPQIGKVYAQMLTPGLRVILEARSSRYLYTTSAKSYRYGGPVAAWAYSTLYTKSVPNEPNLNSDLYQCSLLGTNNVRVLSGVTDFYPQAKGAVIVKRRMSRSGHQLLYINANKPSSAKLLHSAFDFGDAASNDAQTEWAGYVRPTLGGVWNVVIGRVADKGADLRTVPLPDEARPGQIAWSGETLMILVKKGEGTACFEITPKAGTSEWKEAAASAFPRADYVLNKSETLEIEQVKGVAKPVVEVARVWFTGDRNIVAKISNLTLRGYDLFTGRYAFIWGEKGSEPTAYTVDIYTGEVIPGFHGTAQSIKPFRYAPHGSPIGQTPKSKAYIR